MKGRPRVFSQKLLQPQLIGSVHGALSAKAGSHQLSNVAVPGDGHADYCPLHHSGIVFVAPECGCVLSYL